MGRNFRTNKVKDEIIGKRYKTVFDEWYEVIDYKNAHNVTIKFDDNGSIRVGVNKSDVEKGNVKNFYRKYEYGRYLGEPIEHDTRMTRQWSIMFERCYSKSELIKNPNYLGCEICKEWFCFNNFARWYNKNKWGNNKILLEVDKDIKIKRNKIYSPTTCILAPHRINTLFVHSVDSSYRNGLIGTYLNQNGNYTAQCNTGSKSNRNLGSYKTEIEAFNVYKQAKENYIKQIADEYKNKYDDFPKELYNAMYNYIVEEAD